MDVLIFVRWWSSSSALSCPGGCTFRVGPLLLRSSSSFLPCRSKDTKSLSRSSVCFVFLGGVVILLLSSKSSSNNILDRVTSAILLLWLIWPWWMTVWEEGGSGGERPRGMMHANCFFFDWPVIGLDRELTVKVPPPRRGFQNYRYASWKRRGKADFLGTAKTKKPSP